MKILLDECVPQRLRNHLPGHECQSARYAGFAGLENGNLLRAAEAAKFDVLLTVDRDATDLELILRSRGIDTIIVSGVATNVCCETTAREAVVRDFRVFFLSDGTATFDIGDVPASALQKSYVRDTRATVCTSADRR